MLRPEDRYATKPAALPGGKLRRSLTLFGRGLRDEKAIYCLAIGSSALYGISSVAAGWLLGRLTDSVVQPAITEATTGAERTVSNGQIWAAGGWLALVAVLTAVGVVGRRIFAGMAVYHMQATTRRLVTRQYLRLPISWHRKHPTGQLLSNANADAEASFNTFMALPFALGVMIMLVLSSVAMFLADPWIAAAGLVILPLVFVVNIIFERQLSPKFSKAQELRGDVAEVAHESFEAALIVKSMGREQEEERRFTIEANKLRDANMAVGRVHSLLDTVMDVLPTFGTLAVLAVGAIRVGAGEATTGNVVTAAFLLTILAFPVRSIGFVLGDLPGSLVGWDRVARVLDARSTMSDGAAPIPGAGPVQVVVDHLDYSYTVDGEAEPINVLKDMDLSIAPGKVVALVGSTGSGKSTLAQLLVRMDDPTSGTVCVGDVDLRNAAPEAIAGAVALVPQATFLFEDSIRGNVTLSDDAPDERHYDDDAVWSALKLARADGFVRELEDGLDSRVGERGASLSGGQRQRIAIARALIRRPRLLILDDATSAVDPAVEQEILAGLQGDAADGGTTVIVVAYRLATIALADEVVHLDGGRIIDRGTHEELLARDESYRDLAMAYERDSQSRADDAEALRAKEDELVHVPEHDATEMGGRE